MKIRKFYTRCLNNEQHYYFINTETNEIILPYHPDLTEELLSAEKVLAALASESLPGCLRAYEAWTRWNIREAPPEMRAVVLERTYPGLKPLHF